MVFGFLLLASLLWRRGDRERANERILYFSACLCRVGSRIKIVLCASCLYVPCECIVELAFLFRVLLIGDYFKQIKLKILSQGLMLFNNFCTPPARWATFCAYKVNQIPSQNISCSA
jgi:hypothetical protein